MEGPSLSVIGRRFGVSKEAVRQWMAKFEDAFARKRLSRRKVRSIVLLDETEVKRNGRIAYVSVCLDLTRTEVVSARSYRSVGIVSTIDTVEGALELSRGSPTFIVDHAPWYANAFEWLGTEWVPLTFSIRNHIERWYRTFKEDEEVLQQLRRQGREQGHQEGGTVRLFAYWYNPNEASRGAQGV